MDITTSPQVSPVSSPNKTKWILVAVAAAIVVGLVIWFFAGAKGSFGKVLGANTSSTYQAVFLSNGQVYFGKLKEANSGWVELSDVFYLQVTQNLQAATGEGAKDANPTGTATADKSQNIQLVKLGSELHGPMDVMHIDRDKVLFWEDMKDDSKVVAAIKQYKSK